MIKGIDSVGKFVKTTAVGINQKPSTSKIEDMADINSATTPEVAAAARILIRNSKLKQMYLDVNSPKITDIKRLELQQSITNIEAANRSDKNFLKNAGIDPSRISENLFNLFA